MYFQFNNLLKLTLSSILFIVSTYSHAAQFVSELGFHFGGDEFGTLVLTNGDSQSLNSGDGVQYAIGAKFDVSKDTFIKTSIGYSYTDVSATNGSVNWTFIPINVIYYKKTKNWNFGTGITHHISPTISGSGELSNVKINFKDAIGFTMEVDYRTSSDGYFGLKYTLINYVDEFKNIYEGNSIGIVLGAYY